MTRAREGEGDAGREQATEDLDRTLSEAVSRVPARGPWVPLAGGAMLLAALVALHAPRSESHEETGRERAVSRTRTPPPPIEDWPEDEARSVKGQETASPPAAPSPLAEELVATLQRQALQQAEANRRQAAERQRSPIVIYDQASRKAASRDGAGRSGPARDVRAADEERLDLLAPPARAGGTAANREEAFAERAALEPVETVRAERVEHPSTLVPQGTFIQGVLETELQSDLPGMVRAQVSAPVRAFDGTLVVPRGSRLIGRYQSGLVRGQTRVFVIWTRLLRPDGVSMRIDSPGTDVLGRAGVGGDVDTHFFEIFGSSILLSLVDGGLDVAAASAQDGGATVVQTGGAGLNRAAEIALQNRITVAPTIRVPRGTPIQVVVSKDLDFAGADSRMD